MIKTIKALKITSRKAPTIYITSIWRLKKRGTSRGSLLWHFQEDCRNIWSNWPWHSRIQPSHTPTPATSSTLPVCMTHTYDFAHTSWQDGCSTSSVPPTTPSPGAGSLSLCLPEAGSLHIDLSSGLQIRNLGYLFDNEPIGSSHGPVAHSIGEDPPVGTPPLEKHVARSSWWRVAHIIIRTIIIRIPLKVCMVQLSYPDHLKESQALSKEEQTTQAERRHPDGLHNTSGWSAWAIRI